MPDSPSWLLLLWTGLAALLAAAAVVAPITGPSGPRGAVLFFRPTDTLGFLGLFVIGAIVYPALYGMAFELLHTATAIVGALLGLVHAFLLIAFQAISHRSVEKPAVTAVLCTVYGIVIGFLYVSA